MSEMKEIAEKLLAEATAEQDKAAEAVVVAERTLVRRRGKLAEAQRRVRELHADLSALTRRASELRIVK